MGRKSSYSGDDESLDTLYKAMEMAEPKEIRPAATIATNTHGLAGTGETPSESNASSTDYVAIDVGNHHFTSANASTSPAVVATSAAAATTTSTTSPATSTNGLGQSNVNNSNHDDDERAFIWVLLEFLRKRHWKKKLLTILIVASSVSVFIDLIFFGNVVQMVNHFLSWMIQHTVMAVLVCIIFFAAATLVFVPHAILTFGAGWAFSSVCGFWLGSIVALFVSFTGSTLGAILSFVRSRYMMRDLVELFAQRYPIVKAADRAIQRKGFKTMLLLRLCPIIPFNGLNYLGGVTSVSLEDYTKALIGILPITLLWTAIGASADSLSNRQTDEVGEQVFFFFLLFFGIICGFTGIARIYRYARDELRKEIEFDRAESWHKYKRSLSTASGAAASSSSSKSVSSSEAMRDPVVEEGIEVLNRADMTLLAVLGIDGFAVEAQRPPECQDDDPFWYWA